MGGKWDLGLRACRVARVRLQALGIISLLLMYGGTRRLEMSWKTITVVCAATIASRLSLTIVCADACFVKNLLCDYKVDPAWIAKEAEAELAIWRVQR